MYDNYNYPAGADTPDAPWNEAETPKEEFEISIYQSMTKVTKVITDDYNPIYEEDEDGSYQGCDTSDTDWVQTIKENEVYTPLELISFYKEHLEKEYEEYLETHSKKTQQAKRYQALIESCKGWVVEELCIEEQ